jgi:F-type H+-transporting ATPase subunit alpha
MENIGIIRKAQLPMLTFKDCLAKTGEIGFVEELMLSVARVSGLPTAHLREQVLFETGQRGEIISLHAHSADVMVFSREPLRVGTRVVRVGYQFSVLAGKQMLGRIIDPLGEPLEGEKTWGEQDMEWRPVDVRPGGIATRKRITRGFETGVILVDLLIPLGCGQRELVLGDRKTGKSQLLWRAVKTQVKKGNICIYAAVGKKKMEILQTWNFLKESGAAASSVMIASGSNDSSGEIFLTPYTALTLAEYFRDQGKDVLLVIDDMTTHAKYYRELALLSRKFPGRDSYPGDIFHIHSKLLERAGCFEKGSITCLPLAETQMGDMTGYIQTNLMSMTDGHVYFDSGLFFAGRRPAIDPFLSVTRVGRQTQTPLQKDITKRLLQALSDYEKTTRFVKFGTELGENSRAILDMGEKIWQLFDQPINEIVPLPLAQVLFVLLFMGNFDPKNMTRAIETYDEAKITKLLEGCESIEQLSDKINNFQFTI